jgi:hypothetical protein
VPGEAAPAPTPAPPAYHPLRFWLRPLILAVLVVILLALTWWDQRRIPDRPARPDILTATPLNGAGGEPDPGLADALLRLRAALQRRDARALANLADAEGVMIAPYAGGLPEGGSRVSDPYRLSQDLLAGTQVTALNWRSDGRGRVIALTDGWRRRTLRLSGESTLEMTPLAALGLVSRGGTWYWRWLLPDTSGVLAQQARTLVWQPWPQ